MRRANATIALTLVFVLGLGPVLTLAATEKAAGPGILHSKRVPVPPRARRTFRPLQSPTLIDGQTATALPDGRILLVGGLGEDGPRSAVEIQNPRTGKTKSLPAMGYGRAWHTATMLPDGRVLVFGGTTVNDRVLSGGFIVEPTTGAIEEVKTESGLTARAHHTATLLTDGRVLIVGGVSERGRPISKSQLWDYKSQTTESTGVLSLPRQNHKSTLLADGNVLIEGGIDENKGEVKNAELFNVDARSFSPTSISSAEDKDSTPYVAASLPVDGATEVAVESRVAMRFSRPLPLEAVKLGTIKLEAIDEGVAAKIVPAENGRLVFITPLEPLRKATTYKVSVTNSADGSVSITPSSVSFTTVADKEWENRIGNETDWLPGADNLRGNWRTKMEKSEWQDLPPLQAKDGETALSGQVLTLKGQPVSNVTISVKGSSTRTDRTGRFLLPVDEGHQVMLIDGRSASRPGLAYGIFRAGIDVTGGKTNVLPFTIWMPKLDMAHAVKIPSPIKKDTVITNPLIPGLELHLPAGTVIRDLDGKAVTELSITPVPTDRPPFPLPPGLRVPVFASIQPGGAKIIPPRARLIYPNYTHEPAGKRINFWNYDPEGRGWYIYGQGTVTKDGNQIVPDAGVVIYEFTGIMIGSSENQPNKKPKPCNCSKAADPVDLGTGLFVFKNNDFVLEDTIPISLTRTYRPGDDVSRPFGIGSTHPYEMYLWSNNNYQEADLALPDGGSLHYVRVSPGTSFADAVYEHTTTPSSFYKSRIYWNGSGWDLRLKNGTVLVFPELAPLQSIRDRYGNQLTITRANGVLGNITQITSPNGRWLHFSYGTGNRISQIIDNSGRAVSYVYDTSDRLWKVTDQNGGITEYTYDSSHRMLTVKNPRGITFLTNEYDSNDRIITQTQADNSTFQFEYTLSQTGDVTESLVTDPRGNVRRVTFNSDGYALTDTSALGTSVEQTLTFERQSGTNLLLSVIDSLGRKTAYGYDYLSNITTITRLAETQDAVSTSLTYEAGYNELASISDPLNHTTSLGYDTAGNITGLTDPLSHQSTFSYNSSGQILSASDPLSHTTEFTYDAGDLSAVTDPLGRSVTFHRDSLGRVTKTTNPLGNATSYAYDGLNRLTSLTDARQGTTAFSYDETGNLLSVADARNNVISYEYDDMNRVTTRTDPLSHDDSFEYDLNGNLEEVTDREGQVTAFTYDALDRLTEVAYDDDSTITYHYDSVNRVTEIVDSVSGTISYDYDNLDRLIGVTSPQGVITYSYDTANRRTSMTVDGQSAINYTYDNANRLTQITRGTATVTIGYDNANRKTSLSLPNGVTTEYSYDAASQLSDLTYKYGSTTLGNLTYSYDFAGRRAVIGGSYARVALPQAVNSATYDAANRQTDFGSLTLTYDLNGNLVGDGTNNYVWNARHQLVGISGATSASFEYDALGRRVTKTNGSTSTSYLYDGPNIVQELSGSSPTANLITGGIDENFTRIESSGSVNFLADGIGNTLGLTNSSGAVQTEYTYEPFGGTSVTGTGNANTAQFTGRENDGTGIYYYRARYYNSTLQRFLSEDPIGLLGGVNVYAYTENSPTNLSDPSGLEASSAGQGIVDALSDFVSSVKDFLKNTLLPAAASEAAGPMMQGVSAGAAGLKSGGETYEILDGVRRAKAAESVGKTSIPAEIFDAEGKSLGIVELPLKCLRSPKDFIDVGRKVDMDRWQNTYKLTKAGSIPPPIQVTPGTRGIPISGVGWR